MILFEEGRFQLSDPVSQYIPEFANVRVLDDDKKTLRPPSREITIQDLLRHTSGMADVGEGSIVEEYYVNAKLDDRSRTLREIVLKISELPLAFSPGEGWVYGRSTDVLGYLIERIANEPLDQFLHDRVLEPLKMVDTGFFVPREKAHRFAMAYMRSDEGNLGVSESKPFEEWLDRPRLLKPGSGMVSTVNDYFRFSQMLLNRGELDDMRILSPTTVDLMVRNHLKAEILPTEFGGPTWDWMIRGWGFGLGFRVLVNGVIAGSAASHGSYGWFGCRNTFFLVDPKEKLIGIFMAQSDPCVYPGVREIQSLMHQAIDR
jgi:CubicO group peptidase (beta-lactamase class C family)